MSIFSLDPQERRRALDELNAEIGRSLRYYFGPTPIPQLLGFAAEMTPSRTVERASEAAVRMAAPDMTPLQRVGAGAEMLGETAGVVAPLAVGARGAMPMAEAVQEAFMGVSVPARAIGEAVAARATQPGPMPRTLYSNPLGRAPVTFDDAARAMDEGGITAYHGSPHIFKAERLVRMPDGSTQYLVGDVDRLPDVPLGAQVIEDFPMGRFRMSQMGTGEGAQAYGPGLYVAESRGVGQGYRDALSKALINNRPVNYDDASDLASSWVTAMGGDRSKAIDYLQRQVDRPPAGLYRSPEEIETMRQAIEVLRDDAPIQMTSPGGRLYEVNIAARPEQFFNWDMPLAGQTPEIQAAIRQIAPSAPGMSSGQRLMAEIGADVPNPQGFNADRAMVRATERLREAGIPGTSYLDAGSRGAGEGSRNYVVFDEDLMRIVRVYGIGGAAAILGVSAADVEAALAENLPPSEWESLVVGPQ